MTMVERVARAIAKELTGGTPSGPKSIDHRAARAAIKAMRDAPHDVLTAFVDAETDVRTASTRWNAAIDAALNEEPAL